MCFLLASVFGYWLPIFLACILESDELARCLVHTNPSSRRMRLLPQDVLAVLSAIRVHRVQVLIFQWMEEGSPDLLEARFLLIRL